MIKPSDHLLLSTQRNEKPRLPHFLRHYRSLGVNHFLIVDNDSTDGGDEYLAQQEDVSLWSSAASYKAARYGVDWLNWLARRYACGHWVVVADADELLVYPFHDTRPLPALTCHLDATSARSFSAMQLDLYPEQWPAAQSCAEGQAPADLAYWFDAGNYTFQRNEKYGNLWIQGGPRARVFFPDEPARAPALNKIPLVKWQAHYAYVSSTHMLLPRGLNRVYETSGGEKISGLLLHTKLLSTFASKTAEELQRKQHYGNSAEYKAYLKQQGSNRQIWTDRSTLFTGWRQLEALGLMSQGGWA